MTSVELPERVADKADVVPEHDTIEHAADHDSSGEQPASGLPAETETKTDIEGAAAEERVTAKAWLCVFVRQLQDF